MLLLSAWGCAGGSTELRDESPPPPPKPLPAIGHTIQVGAFSRMENAVRFTAKLTSNDINAYHFRHHTGLYKVRFGSYASRYAAVNQAESLKSKGLFEDYFIVDPQEFAAVSRHPDASEHLRNEIVRTAKQYIGLPYRWGGESAQAGFDCSGLTMVVYRLNGLDLPRSSGRQWQAGKPVNRGQLAKGDLVFFATAGGARVSHVGIYTGRGKFLHAPRRGRKIRISSLSNTYYRSRYLGARSYL